MRTQSTARRREPKYRLYRPKNLGVVRLDGKDHYCPGPYGSDESLAEYYRLLADWKAGRLAKGDVEPVEETPALTVSELILRHWGHVRSYYVKDGQPTSEQACIRSALRYLRRLFGRTPAADFGPKRLKAVRQSMIAADLARSTINKHVGRIRRLFQWAVENELLPVEIHLKLCAVRDLPKNRSEARETEPVGPVTDAQIEAVLPELSDVVAAMVRFQRLTGCRPSEVCRLRPCDVDRSGEVWCYRPESHKTEHHDRERRIYIGPQAQAILRPYLDRTPESYCFDPREATKSETPSAPAKSQRDKATRPRPRRRGCRYTEDSYRRSIARACERAGIESWSPNQLRHASATEVRQKYGLEGSQTVLGHRKANVTELYAERDFAKAREIIAKIG